MPHILMIDEMLLYYRLTAICFPMKVLVQCTRARSLKVIGFLWLFGFILMIKTALEMVCSMLVIYYTVQVYISIYLIYIFDSRLVKSPV